MEDREFRGGRLRVISLPTENNLLLIRAVSES